MPPALGFNKCVNVDACWLCLCGVKRVPSTKVMTLTGLCLNLAQAFFVVSISLPRMCGFLAKNFLL